MLPALLLAIFLSLQMAAGNPLLASPLFGYSLGGDPFDDGAAAVIPPVARLHSVLICHGDAIDGIQLVYILENNSTFIAPPHGTINDKCSKDSKMTKILFKESEILLHVEGLIQKWWDFISQLTLFTSVDGGPPKCRGGPFGRGDTSNSNPFSLTGDIRGIFGRTGDVLDAIGFYVNAPVPLSSYQKTDPIGKVSQDGCDEFDDFKILGSKNEKPFKITNMVINYGVYIKGVQVTYLTSNGTFVTLIHGMLNRTTGWDTALLTFDDDEWITKSYVSTWAPSYTGASGLGSIEVETINSKGSVRSYGPWRPVNSWAASNITTVNGIIYGLYGCSKTDIIYNLGFYV